jgi:hypothetical protein
MIFNYQFSPKIGKLFFLLFFIFVTVNINAQISHGGSPLPLNAGVRALAIKPEMFVEMPSFDVAEELRSSENNAQFKSLYFAHKFYVHLRPDNSGIRFATSDGTNVWRVGIRSRGAYSINILFSKFHLSKGAKVFVYNTDQTQILGSYTDENNTEHNLLPVQPIGGEELIVELQEPENSDSISEIEIGEVNHDFLGLFRAGTEPRDPSQSCHPNLVCYPEDAQAGSGVLELIINGNTYCTGALVNNTAQDGTPYLLTATHCLNKDYNAAFLSNRKYDVVAGSIIAFFHYESPVCDASIRGNTQMTLAGADSVLISEKHDISLLRFLQIPPREYQPYYLGWNVSSAPSAPFHGIHHPNGGIKKIAVESDALTITSFGTSAPYNMESNSHWNVAQWDVASTEKGSSGSPLVDKDKRLVGTLSGGLSECSSPKGPDQYASLNKFWNVEGSINNPNPIKYYLDPVNSAAQQLNGFNPYENAPMMRENNFDSGEKVTQTTYNNTINLFQTNTSLGYSEFAEQFYSKNEVQIAGVFISTPATTNISRMDVRIKVYSGLTGPEILLSDQKFNYSFQYYSGGSYLSGNRDMNTTVENYIRFASPVTVSGKFFISYSDVNGTAPGFCVLNTEPRNTGSGLNPTAWMKNSAGWALSSENMYNPVNTSLLISPYVVGSGLEGEEQLPELFELNVTYNREVQRIFAESNQEIVSWEIFYVTGQKIFAQQIDKSVNLASYSASHLAKGVYMVRVITTHGSGIRKVLVR